LLQIERDFSAHPVRPVWLAIKQRANYGSVA